MHSTQVMVIAGRRARLRVRARRVRRQLGLQPGGRDQPEHELAAADCRSACTHTGSRTSRTRRTVPAGTGLSVSDDSRHRNAHRRAASRSADRRSRPPRRPAPSCCRAAPARRMPLTAQQKQRALDVRASACASTACRTSPTRHSPPGTAPPATAPPAIAPRATPPRQSAINPSSPAFRQAASKCGGGGIGSREPG